MAASILCGSGFAVLKPERRRFEAPAVACGTARAAIRPAQ
ncbi:hypothetical protein METH_11800 [Leisingera methylohalidivorans DSM 14336]|uniref:Uncharacterized protein n=1 Tax=Leisingera methylohalidivorans DSM 14336 TaxID=999552 RepID=V9VWF9_9RHOB|nr:hypothetical protein METH_11800 [Leisingera methylohalidivorans DSM 14336]